MLVHPWPCSLIVRGCDTRTLTWVGQGYPGKGLAVESQYVFSAFEDKFVVSSLESLETVLETDNDLFSISRVAQVIVEDEEVKS